MIAIKITMDGLGVTPIWVESKLHFGDFEEQVRRANSAIKYESVSHTINRLLNKGGFKGQNSAAVS